MPDPNRFQSDGKFRHFSRWFKDPNLWHLNRNSVAKGFFIGLFWMAQPLPWQMAFSAITAIIFRANLPISVALVWITNPVTMGPFYYFNYRIGSLLLGERAQENLSFELSFEWISHTFMLIWQPLVLGSLVVGIALASISYVAMHILWRWHVNLSWKRRLHSRKGKKIFKKPKFLKKTDSVHKHD